ncbi:alkylphosphocholine resistance protein lem3 [Entomophthora muscae]|uniref:Alkylphosphocholine resistance protein lem3 n=1 Tax=Entomophthora muscae TaxID=34485 RepID=A0ACC2SWC8_9FUNG|nr:alkylphosphocholine resistance protein lem3 [Entomophthora muscae]
MSEPPRKSRKPANTAFKQQRLKSWQPILTPKSVLPTLFILGAIFRTHRCDQFNPKILEISIDYTKCKEHDSFHSIEHLFRSSLPNNSSSIFKGPKYKSEKTVIPGNPNDETGFLCTIQFPITVDIPPPVYLYYELTEFYQNHRSYVKSVSWPQLRGEENLDIKALRDVCKPLAGKEVDGVFIPFYPCGLIANSIFNDTIYQLTKTENQVVYEFSEKNIGLSADKERYKKPPYHPKEVLPPPYWVNRYTNGVYSDEQPPPDFSQDEHFWVWLRTAGLPRFRKLYGRNDTTVIPKGMYEIKIMMNYDISKYGGKKYIVFSTIGNLGGRNSFLGLAYISMGAVSVLLGILFTARHFFKPR